MKQLMEITGINSYTLIKKTVIQQMKRDVSDLTNLSNCGKIKYNREE